MASAAPLLPASDPSFSSNGTGAASPGASVHRSHQRRHSAFTSMLGQLPDMVYLGSLGSLGPCDPAAEVGALPSILTPPEAAAEASTQQASAPS